MKPTREKSTWEAWLAIATLGWVVSACGPLSTSTQPQEATLSMDGVKLISPEITRGDDPSTFGQARYTLNQNARLLLRFENLASRLKNIVVDKDNRFVLQFTVDASADAITQLQNHLSVCPLTKNWMMLATWTSAHPFGEDGNWATPGGDLDTQGCIGKFTVEDKTLSFDMSQWYLDYPTGLNVNYGFAVLAEQDVKVLGEKSGSHSPRVLCMQTQ